MNDPIAPVEEAALSREQETRLDRSRLYCQRLTRAAARNFYYGLRLLPPAKQAAMYALYAYMRHVDDIADADDGRSVQQREQDLEHWRLRTHAALGGELPPESPDGDIWPAFNELIQTYRIPSSLFDEAIAGQSQDLHPQEPATFDELRQYCFRVAGVVGLASIHIWGFVGGPETEALAIDRGVAFQLTNILRDVREDAGRGRIYLPREDLVRMKLTEQDLLNGNGGRQFCELVRFEVERAESYFAKSQPLDDRVCRDSRPTLVAMTDIYRSLLRKVAADPQRVLRERVSLSIFTKLRIGWRAVRAARQRQREGVHRS
jgi:phytoene synthase